MKNENKIIEFLEELAEEFNDGEPNIQVEISYSQLCELLHATGKYDRDGYKLVLHSDHPSNHPA